MIPRRLNDWFRARRAAQLAARRPSRRARPRVLDLEDRVVLSAFTPGNLVVYRVGDASTALAATGARVFLDEFTPSGTLVQSIAMPFEGDGAKLVASGTASSEGLLTRSVDGRFIALAGYNATIPTAGLAGTASATVNRSVALVSANGQIDSISLLSDFASGNNPRGVATVDGSDVWVTGGAGGLRHFQPGATTSTLVAGTPANLRSIHIFNDQLYVSTASGSTVRIGAVGSGLPTTAGQLINSLPGLPIATGSPYAFALADLNPAIPGVDTLYVADDNAAGSLIKYSLVETTPNMFAWQSNGAIDGGTYRGLTIEVVGTTVTIFAVRNGGTGAGGGGQLVTLVDASGHNGAFSGTPVVLASALTGTSANTSFRGVAFAPSGILAKTAGDNQSTQISTAFADNLEITVGALVGDGKIAGVPVTFTIVAGAGGASGTFAGDLTTVTVVTDSNGVALAPALAANATAGAFTVVANWGNRSATFNLENTEPGGGENTPPVVVGDGVPDQTVDEDAPAFTIDLSLFFQDAEDDELVFSVETNSDSSIVAASIVGNILTLTPQPDAFGNVSITIRATDSEGAFVTDMFNITVNPVNDAPVVDLDDEPPVSATAGDGPVVVENFATLSPGPENESDQELEIEITVLEGADLFDVPPAVSLDGTLSFTPVSYLVTSGVAVIQILVRDDGGTDNGGVDTTIKTFTIEIAANARPIVGAGDVFEAFQGRPTGLVQLAVFDDPDNPAPVAGDYVATVDWLGDGNPVPAAVSVVEGRIVVSGSFAFPDGGVFFPAVLLTHTPTGRTAEATATANVYANASAQSSIARGPFVRNRITGEASTILTFKNLSGQTMTGTLRVTLENLNGYAVLPSAGQTVGTLNGVTYIEIALGAGLADNAELKINVRLAGAGALPVNLVATAYILEEGDELV